MVAAGGRGASRGAAGREAGELVFHGYRVSVREDEIILERDGSESCRIS